MKRTLRINMLDGSTADFEIKRAVEIKVVPPILEFRELKGGGFQVTYSKSFINDLSKIHSFQIVRED